jgi:proteasome lid subunit RPN8/RPN11
VAQAIAFENAREDSRHNRYLIAPEQFLAAERAAPDASLDVLGVFHSHPDHPAEPSAFDREHAWPRLSYIIVSVAAGRSADLKSWRLSDDRTAFAEEPITLEPRKAAWQSPS